MPKTGEAKYPVTPGRSRGEEGGVVQYPRRARSSACNMNLMPGPPGLVPVKYFAFPYGSLA